MRPDLSAILLLATVPTHGWPCAVCRGDPRSALPARQRFFGPSTKGSLLVLLMTQTFGELDLREKLLEAEDRLRRARFEGTLHDIDRAKDEVYRLRDLLRACGSS